jgi:DNA (cytosine-5)-methyltransferase 1
MDESTIKVLDLFSGAGGCSVGLLRAGFMDITGVDIKPQKRYPFRFIQADALEYLAEYGNEFDLIIASPPCQPYSVTASLSNGDYPKLIEPLRKLLHKIGKPYVIENVPGAPLENPILLCGTMFDLRVIRHRLFEIWPEPIWLPPRQCQHIGKASGNENWVGKKRNLTNWNYLTITGHDFIVADARIAMGIDWMSQSELAQAIPPAYTEWLGKQIRNIYGW